MSVRVLKPSEKRFINSVTAAWRVDFNIAISSMEPLIAGTRRLIDLALASPNQSPPHFVFASSLGAVRSESSNTILTCC